MVRFAGTLRLLVIWLVLRLLFVSLCVATEISNVRHQPDPVGTYDKLEIRFDLDAAYSNPYDPAEIDARVEFQGADQQVHSIPAFWFEGYNRWVDEAEHFTPSGEVTWMARIVGPAPGTYNYRVVVNDHQGYTDSGWRSFVCIPSTDRGFVRVDERNPHFLCFDDGSPYTPIGHNLCWGAERGGGDVINWQTKMAAQGENWTRYWMSMHTAGQPLEWNEGDYWHGLGRYSQQIACRFDAMLEHARSLGIRVQLCMDSFNAWNVETYANWEENPYNVARGGMLSEPYLYFTNAQAQELARNKFRYIVARWAYATSVLCWEFFNEADIIGAGGPPSGTFAANLPDAVQWHQDMAVYMRGLDPFEHLRTTSFSNDGDPLRYPEIWDLAAMDFIQCHRYSNLSPAAHVSLVQQALVYNKPVVLAEWGMGSIPQLYRVSTAVPSFVPFGYDSEYRRIDKLGRYVDPSGQRLHDAIWGLGLAGSSAMSWWWREYIDPGNLYGVFRPLSVFMNGEDWAGAGVQPSQLNYSLLSGPSDLSVIGSQSASHAYFWIRDYVRSTTTGVSVRLSGLDDGNRLIEVWDTYSGTVRTSYSDSVAGGSLDVALPEFSNDLAVKVIGELPTATPSPTASPSPTETPYACLGDADRSGFVNADDFRSVRAHFGEANPDLGDANYDGFVNAMDYYEVREQFGVPCR